MKINWVKIVLSWCVGSWANDGDNRPPTLHIDIFKKDNSDGPQVASLQKSRFLTEAVLHSYGREGEPPMRTVSSNIGPQAASLQKSRLPREAALSPGEYVAGRRPASRRSLQTHKVDIRHIIEDIDNSRFEAVAA